LEWSRLVETEIRGVDRDNLRPDLVDRLVM
jgi:hypothetical protein